jgi:DNA-binding transcriptional LysR family regulator
VQLYVSHYLAIPAIVAQSDLLGTVPRQLAEHFARHYALQIFPLPLQMPAVQVSLIWHQQQDRAVGLRWLKEQIVEAFRTDP